MSDKIRIEGTVTVGEILLGLGQPRVGSVQEWIGRASGNYLPCSSAEPTMHTFHDPAEAHFEGE